MTVETLIQEAKKLSAVELDALVEQLTVQLSDQADSGAIDAWNVEIARRWESFVAGEAEVLDWDTARERMFGPRE